MPAKSERQRKLFGTALSMKRGKSKITDTPAGKIAENLSEYKIRDFAKKSLSEQINDFVVRKEQKLDKDFKSDIKGFFKPEKPPLSPFPSEKEARQNLMSQLGVTQKPRKFVGAFTTPKY